MLFSLRLWFFYGLFVRVEGWLKVMALSFMAPCAYMAARIASFVEIGSTKVPAGQKRFVLQGMAEDTWSLSSS